MPGQDTFLGEKILCTVEETRPHLFYSRFSEAEKQDLALYIKTASRHIRIHVPVFIIAP
jgi:hypothetical protein